MVFWGLKIQANQNTWARLEAEQYGKEESVLLKIPMAMPYAISEGFYENSKKEFEHNGTFYKVIKQKLERDTLFVICVKDQKEKHLENTLATYEKVANDVPSKSKQSQNLLSKVLKEYEAYHQIEIIEQSGWLMAFTYSHTNLTIITFERSVQAPPPKQLS